MSPIKKYSFFFGLNLISSYISAGQIIILNGGDAEETSSDQNPAEISIDYFFGEASLRSDRMPCDSDQLKHECLMECGTNNYGCMFGECYCLNREVKKNHKSNDNLPPSKEDIKMMINAFEDLIEAPFRANLDAEELEEDEIEDRPALRHHIAHFCPDLEVARKCIRTCMQVGKPAFCGKDHRCYCGHKYSEHDQKQKINIDDVNEQFRDLYTKYFGPEIGVEYQDNQRE